MELIFYTISIWKLWGQQKRGKILRACLHLKNPTHEEK